MAQYGTPNGGQSKENRPNIDQDELIWFEMLSRYYSF